jgi:hypothetical protein
MIEYLRIRRLRTRPMASARIGRLGASSAEFLLVPIHSEALLQLLHPLPTSHDLPL